MFHYLFLVVIQHSFPRLTIEIWMNQPLSKGFEGDDLNRFAFSGSVGLSACSLCPQNSGSRGKVDDLREPFRAEASSALEEKKGSKSLEERTLLMRGIVA